MHDVAARAHVSHQTVSRVLNDFPGIRPETRRRVLEAIDELGYRRNLAARTLATGRSQVIGIIGPSIPDIGPMSTIHEIERVARAAGFHTMLTSTDADPRHVITAVDFLVGRGLEALAVVAQERRVLDAVEQAGLDVPVVYLHTAGAPQSTTVSIDQRMGVRLLAEHLSNLGHTLIQHVAGPADNLEAQSRNDEFSSYVRSLGLEQLPVIQADWTPDSGYASAALIDPRATAVICANDQIAFGLIHALAESGRSVPGELSVVGFDDTAEASHSLPPLTTVHQDFAAVGRLAIDQLVALLDGEGQAGSVAIEPVLQVRASTAPPRAR